jgi:O-antigen/teichoic acid export membrane protein
MLNASSQVGATQSTTSAVSDQNILTAAKGGGITLFGAVFEYTTRFVLGILLARFMGAEQYGLYSLANTALSILTGMALLGLTAGILRYVPVFVHNRDEEALWGTLQVGLGIPVVISVFMGIGLFVFADSFANLVFHEPRLTPLLRVAAIAVPFSALMYATASATRGFKQMQHKVIAQDISLTLIKLVLVVLLAFVGLNAVGAMTAHAVAIIAACAMLLYFLHRLFSLNRPLKAAQFNAMQMLAFSLPVYFGRLVAIFGGSIQTLLLGALNTVLSVGIFTAASRVSIVGKMFHNSIVAVAMPIVSELHSKGDQKQLAHFYQTMTKWTFSFNLPLFMVVLLFSQPILSIFGDSFVAGSMALIVLSAGNLVDAGTGICGVIINMTGHTRLNTVNSMLVFVLTLALNLLLIPSLGMMGAAIAMSVATIVLNLTRLLEVFVLFRLLPYNRSFIKPILAGLTATTTTFAVTHWISDRADLVYLILSVTFLLVIYVFMILLLGLSQEDQMILKRLRGRLGRTITLKRNHG